MQRLATARRVMTRRATLTSPAAKRIGMLSTTMLTAAGMAMLLPGAARADNWGDHTYDAGNVDVDVSLPNTTTLTQHDDFVKAHGDGDINEGWTVNLLQPGASSKYVLFDVENDPAVIRGALNANGQVFIFDKNGVIFGDTSRVDVGAIVTSTGHVSDANIVSGNLAFEDVDTGGAITVDSGAVISVAEGGLAAFVAPTVSNSGIINAKMGRVVLASGEKVSLDLYGDGLFEVVVDGAIGNALLENKGQINAEGGTVIMDVKSARDVVDNVINMDGVIDVSSVTQQGGKIILSGGSKGTVKVTGTADASGTTGGKIAVKGRNINVGEGAVLAANATAGNGGTIDVIANDHTDFRGFVLARGGGLGGNGGFVEISGYEGLGYSGYADLGAEDGDLGTLLLDPSFAVIHSGLVNNPLGLSYVLASWALANAMENANVVVQADNFIDVGTKSGNYNTGIQLADLALNTLVGTGNIDLSTYKYDTTQLTKKFPFIKIVHHEGTTAGSITFDSQTVNFNKDLYMGKGNVTVDAGTINLAHKIYGPDKTTLLGDSRLIGTGDVSTINVLSNDASINQGINFADDDAALTTVDVRAGTYDESVLVDHKNLLIKGANFGIKGVDHKHKASTVDPNSPGFHVTADDVTIDGFTITGATGSDGYGIWVDGASNVTITNNDISDTAQDGIFATTDYGTIKIAGNSIADTGYHGIRVLDFGNAWIANNTIRYTGDDGIALNNGAFAAIHGNTIYAIGNYVEGGDENGADGINVHGVGSASAVPEAPEGFATVVDNASVQIFGNNVSYTLNDGIEVTGSDTVHIENNDVTHAGYDKFSGDGYDRGDGITVSEVDSAVIKNNRVGWMLGDGIYVDSSHYAGVFGNKVLLAGDEGIEIANVTPGSLEYEDEDEGDQDGDEEYPDSYGALVNVENNEVALTGEHGIYVHDSGQTRIVNNDVTFTGLGYNIFSHNNFVASLVFVGPPEGSPEIPENPSLGIEWGGSGDGIRVENVFLGKYVGKGDSKKDAKVIGEPEYDTGSEWAVLIQGNDISWTTGDGIHVSKAGRTLIGGYEEGQSNTVYQSGVSYTVVDGYAYLENLLADGPFAEENVAGLWPEQNIVTVVNDFIVPKIDEVDHNTHDNIHVRNIYSEYPEYAGQVLPPDEDGGDGEEGGEQETGPEFSGYGVEIIGNILNTAGDDGIDVAYASSVLVKDNNVTGSGVGGTDGLAAGETDEILVDFGDGSRHGADGIVVHNVYGEEHYNIYAGDDYKEYAVVIDGNVVDTTADDGIDLFDAGDVLVSDNTVRHAGFDEQEQNQKNSGGGHRNKADGIHVEDVYTALVEDNRVTDVKNDGIRVKDANYAGVFDNKVLLAGDEGIEISDITTPEMFALDGDEEYPDSYGWTVNVENNEVALTGEHGIYVHDSGSTRIVGNDVIYTGLSSVVENYVNTQHEDAYEHPLDQIIDGDYPEGDEEDEEEEIAYFGIEWGRHGDGIKVEDVHGQSGILPPPPPIDLPEDDENGRDYETPLYLEWSVLIQGNDVAWTGGDGIDVSDSGRTLIGGYEEGQANTVYQAGIDFTSIEGYDSFEDLLSSGPFADEARLDLWPEQDMTDIVDGHITPAITHVDHNDHDGIRVRDVYSNSGFPGPFPYPFPLPGATGDGFEGYAVEIIGNTVHTTGDDGIDVAYVGSVLIKDNTVTGAGVAGDDGLAIGTTEDELVNQGEGGYRGADGIVVHDVYGESNYLPYPTIVEEGPYEYNPGNITTYAVVIDGNTVDSTADDGIEAYDVGRILVSENDVTNAGLYGVTGEYYYDEESGEPVFYPDYNDGYGADGIHVRNALNGEVGVIYGLYGESGPVGYYDPELPSVEIVGNSVGVLGSDGDGESEPVPFVPGAADDGIQVLASGNTLIGSNHIAHIGVGGENGDIDYQGSVDEWGADGIHVLNGFIDTGDEYAQVKTAEEYSYSLPYFLHTTVDIVDNTVDIVEDDGIEAQGVTDLLIGGNEVTDAGDNGINILALDGFANGGEGGILYQGYPVLVGTVFELPEFNSDVIGNTVTDSGTNGLFVEGAGHNNVFVADNGFIDNPTGANFESGTIDLTGAGNAFLGGQVGLLFSPFAYGEGVFAPLSLVDDDAPGADTLGGTFPPSNFGGTIGTQFFSGQGAAFIRLANGAFFNPGTPTILNGLDSTYDTPFGLITPSLSNGILSFQEYSFLENQIFHYVDDNTLGLFFFGYVVGIAQEDIFNIFDPANFGGGGLNITLLGLPRIPGGQSFGNLGPAALNAINTFAGGDSNDTLTPDELNAIVTAAGGEDGGEGGAPVNCWGDAVNKMFGGQAVNYSYGTSLEDTVSGAAGCSSSF